MPAPTTPTTRSGHYVRDLRREMDLTQVQFANLIGYQQAHISRVESGNAELSPSLAWALATKAGADVGELDHIVSGLRPFLRRMPLEPSRHVIAPVAA